ncbi:MAG: class I SAM-dependent methyltransferase [Xanthomonadales bacterium]|nr:class I SAM-dependent methyltransferase [Gammaproteobacteria bacterium]MBT8052780.1 class I SAM-dependent methyltransferase [Gammaproteobacteria bacterium]NND56157.1 class I SAM-dependent methyltransferase [Xanthomonadales bacterium]NNK50562.1 class I SAM-dependent methyltransferase [Xanthomonadales bacterium]
MAVLKRNRLAAKADRHHLYQESVQDTESEIDFVEHTWSELRGRPAEFLREDFCGTANTACEWIRRDPQHYAIGIDLDGEVLQWGRLNNLAQLDPEQQSRIRLLQENVLDAEPELADIVLAMNFSYYLFLSREDLLEYFRCVYDGLVDDGVFFLDAYGGYDAPREIEEERECDGFTYIWEQASFNPIDSTMTCHIHFEFADRSRLDRAFSYYWRLWTLPEIRELLTEAGFGTVTVYWEGTDGDTNEGDGIYSPSESGDADPGWVCYVVAQR